MIRLVFLLLIFFTSFKADAQKPGKLTDQKIDGQWRGYYNSEGNIVSSKAKEKNAASDDNTEFVLELDIKDSTVSGYSYSYFQNRLYFVICSVKGKYNKKEQSILVTETARIGGVTPPPPYWSDCLQTHYLKYQKEKGAEQLVGMWKTAPGQLSGCGTGSTTLVRKTLSKNITGYKKPSAKISVSRPVIGENINREALKIPVPLLKDSVINKDSTVISKQFQPLIKNGIEYEKRINTLIKTVEIDNETCKVDLYDNGEIDGDTISLFYNGKLLLYHQGLTSKPISLILTISDNDAQNELTMYAETLGEIPPNTALMIVTDGANRYEVHINSDLKKSGTIRFVRKKR
ncbi:MAG: hypothetical protein HY305_07710 [Sphingobacteriales bacterium]|nr:hypothetical protein [Sphingobacteriales bacterium]